MTELDQRLAEERWRGSVDQRINELERRVTGINGSVADTGRSLGGVLLELSKLTAADRYRTRATWMIAGLLGSTAGAVVSGLAVYLATGG